MLSVTRELMEPLRVKNLRGLATWELVAEAQFLLQQAEDWSLIQAAGGDCEAELEQANYCSNLIGAELKRRSQFLISEKAQAANIELRALKDLSKDESLIDLMSHYVEVIRFGGAVKFRCPLHGSGHDTDPSGVIHANEGKWHCFGCNRHGDVFDALMIYGRLTFGEAVSLLGRYFGIEVGRGNGE